METVMSEFLPTSWTATSSPHPQSVYGLPQASAMKLLRVLATSGRHACARLVSVCDFALERSSLISYVVLNAWLNYVHMQTGLNVLEPFTEHSHMHVTLMLYGVHHNNNNHSFPQAGRPD